jgi:hypothetical protein
VAGQRAALAAVLRGGLRGGRGAGARLRGRGLRGGLPARRATPQRPLLVPPVLALCARGRLLLLRGAVAPVLALRPAVAAAAGHALLRVQRL